MAMDPIPPTGSGPGNTWHPDSLASPQSQISAASESCVAAVSSVVGVEMCKVGRRRLELAGIHSLGGRVKKGDEIEPLLSSEKIDNLILLKQQ